MFKPYHTKMANNNSTPLVFNVLVHNKHHNPRHQLKSATLITYSYQIEMMPNCPPFSLGKLNNKMLLNLCGIYIAIEIL